jgi:hypothetical protein
MTPANDNTPPPANDNMPPSGGEGGAGASTQASAEAGVDSAAPSDSVTAEVTTSDARTIPEAANDDVSQRSEGSSEGNGGAPASDLSEGPKFHMPQEPEPLPPWEPTTEAEPVAEVRPPEDAAEPPEDPAARESPEQEPPEADGTQSRQPEAPPAVEPVVEKPGPETSASDADQAAHAAIDVGPPPGEEGEHPVAEGLDTATVDDADVPEELAEPGSDEASAEEPPSGEQLSDDTASLDSDEGELEELNELFHFTYWEFWQGVPDDVDSSPDGSWRDNQGIRHDGHPTRDGIRREGLNPDAHLSDDGTRAPDQGNLDLTLPTDRRSPDTLIRVDVAAMRRDGLLKDRVPEPTTVSRVYAEKTKPIPGNEKGERIAANSEELLPFDKNDSILLSQEPVDLTDVEARNDFPSAEIRNPNRPGGGRELQLLRSLRDPSKKIPPQYLSVVRTWR